MRTKEPMNPTERRRHDRILWLGLLALLLATACGSSADPGSVRTYRIRRLADPPWRGRGTLRSPWPTAARW